MSSCSAYRNIRVQCSGLPDRRPKSGLVLYEDSLCLMVFVRAKYEITTSIDV